ncbi:DNA internalization-related competence protein ComEC/Rec2 [Bacillus sp. B-jedd]|uniref:DNA internalization-related competence protein ComEC/Rec2 n=1 Tax=Bacillus sp. B-jedd TaxID=1476857 RepID=UPI0005156DFB|nr:DNA internalization-related competence protein ComEC/Rec2 [Bacillus sp. B-jedd]CEG27936.1 DNA internalization-related competence protein ComEC/Rec2 [Bacillus sp. B-jedd]
MKGKLIFLAPPALLGTMLALHGPHPILAAFFLYLIFLTKFKRFSPRVLCIVITIFMLFALAGNHSVQKNHSALSGMEKEFFLVFDSGAKIDGDRFRTIAKDRATGESLSIIYKIKSEREKMLLQRASFFGRQCEVKGTLEQPPHAKNPGGFDYNRYLEQNQIHWILKLDSNPLAKCGTKNVSLVEKLRKYRQEGISHIMANYPLESASLASALIFGEQSLLGEDVMSAYKKIGITHLLAISGMQVTVLAGVIYMFGLRLGIVRERMAIFLLSILPLYAIIAGGSPSVIRSVLMAGILLMGGLRPSSFPISQTGALALSFMAFIFWDPFTLYDPGFQLSYAVTFSLLVSASALKKKHFGGVMLLAVSSLISQIAALPILLFHFFELPLASILANILFIPIYSFILMPVVYFSFPLSFFEGLAYALGPLMNSLVILSEKLALLLARTPFQLNPGEQPTTAIVFYAAAVLYSFTVWEKNLKKKWAVAVLLIPFTLLVVQEGGERFSSHTGEVVMIDVGQGESIFVSLPGGKGNYLIDTGGNTDFGKKAWQQTKKDFDPGRDVVVPFLKARGITKLDKLILTHGDEDHIGGAAGIMENIKIDQILVPDMREKSENEEQVIQRARKLQIDVNEVSKDAFWAAGGVKFLVLSPEKNYKGDRNGGSIVLFAELADKGWLFTGDLTEEAEKELVAQYPELKIDVLKAGHHGSKTSTSSYFLEHYKPSTVLISAGVNNRFGHPHKETLERIKEVGAVVYRTDLNGAVIYSFTGKSGTFSSVLPYTGASKDKKKAK